MEWLYFFEQNKAIINLAVTFLSGGALIEFCHIVNNKYKSAHEFDILMNEINRDNVNLAKNSGTYITRKTLEEEVDRFIRSNCKYCNISGAAGSGKTRLALNLLNKNQFFSPYYYVFFNKSNASYLDDENLLSIRGSRKYVFVFDYVYENKERIRRLIEISRQTGWHKFIFIERDYTGLPFPCDYEISMKDYSMSIQDLTKIFLNRIKNDNPKTRITEDDAGDILEKTYDKLDKEKTRPIIAILLADIYSKKKNIVTDIETMNDLIKSYWEYKSDNSHIEDIGQKYNLIIDGVFRSNLDRLVRSLLLVTAVTKKAINVMFSSDQVLYELDGHDVDISLLINSICDQRFINAIGGLSIDCFIELFGKLLKEQLIVDRNREYFSIVSELDIVSEWLLYDILDHLNRNQMSTLDFTEYWGNKLRLFLENCFPDDYTKFMSRAAIDFDDMVEFYGYTLSNNVDNNEYILHINDMLTKLYDANSTRSRKQILDKLNRYLGDIKLSVMERDQYREIQILAWQNLKTILLKHVHEVELANDILEIYRQRIGE